MQGFVPLASLHNDLPSPSQANMNQAVLPGLPFASVGTSTQHNKLLWTCMQVAKTVNERISKYAQITLESCAYAGTGNVLKVQQLLAQAGEHFELKEDESWKVCADTVMLVYAAGRPCITFTCCKTGICICCTVKTQGAAPCCTHQVHKLKKYKLDLPCLSLFSQGLMPVVAAT